MDHRIRDHIGLSTSGVGHDRLGNGGYSAGFLAQSGVRGEYCAGDKVEVGEPFFVELTWRLNAQNCLLHVQTSPGRDGVPSTTFVVDDGLFNGVVSHAVFHKVDEEVVTA